ncbi:MAG TPA: DUF1963 domain-containing protein [Acidimicrobiales bacterium]|jgi:hypothetical protein|nr:DUF1963 domain-containing protein [Acidimicrobiales bacterium]
MLRRGLGTFHTDEPDLPSARDQLLDALQPWRDAQRRPAWRPVVRRGEPAREGGRSKFCGVAWRRPGEPVATCAHCGRPLQLFVQLDLGELPAELEGRYGEGVLQLFYCVGGPEVDDHPECIGEDGWAPFSDAASLVRVVPGDPLAPVGAPDDGADGADGFAAAAIVGWERFDDLPDPEDHDLAGLWRAYDADLRTVSVRCPEVGLEATVGLDDLDVDDIAQAAGQDKLAGWPRWDQGREYPACPTCGATMRLVLQLDSEDHVPFMFGDLGIGHVTQCPVHHDVVAFGWAGS